MVQRPMKVEAQKRPLSMREMNAKKQTQKDDDENKVTIVNTSKQLIKIHQKAPKDVDFYIGASDINLGPGKMHTFKKSRLWPGQVDRLSKRGIVSIVSDTSVFSQDKTKKQVVIRK